MFRPGVPMKIKETFMLGEADNYGNVTLSFKVATSVIANADPAQRDATRAEL